MDQIKIIFPRLYQLDTIYSADCHGRRTEKKKKQKKKNYYYKIISCYFSESICMNQEQQKS